MGRRRSKAKRQCQSRFAFDGRMVKATGSGEKVLYENITSTANVAVAQALSLRLVVVTGVDDRVYRLGLKRLYFEGKLHSEAPLFSAI